MKRLLFGGLLTLCLCGVSPEAEAVTLVKETKWDKDGAEVTLARRGYYRHGRGYWGRGGYYSPRYSRYYYRYPRSSYYRYYSPRYRYYNYPYYYNRTPYYHHRGTGATLYFSW